MIVVSPTDPYFQEWDLKNELRSLHKFAELKFVLPAEWQVPRHGAHEAHGSIL